MRAMRQGLRQQVAGVVVNERPNVPRPDYDALKATLHNCVRHGPDGQNRESHPDFRAHLARSERLRAVFDRIAW
jgi:RNA-directed DNA polymerase